MIDCTDKAIWIQRFIKHKINQKTKRALAMSQHPRLGMSSPSGLCYHRVHFCVSLILFGSIHFIKRALILVLCECVHFLAHLEIFNW